MVSPNRLAPFLGSTSWRNVQTLPETIFPWLLCLPAPMSSADHWCEQEIIYPLQTSVTSWFWLCFETNVPRQCKCDFDVMRWLFSRTAMPLTHKDDVAEDNTGFAVHILGCVILRFVTRGKRNHKTSTHARRLPRTMAISTEGRATKNNEKKLYRWNR